MLNTQQLTEALAFQAFKAMQFENMAAQLEQHCKKLVDELSLLKKQCDEQQAILQQPDPAPELRDEIDRLKEANKSLAEDHHTAERALRDIAFSRRPELDERGIAHDALQAMGLVLPDA